jgi:hypothetical protein
MTLTAKQPRAFPVGPLPSGVIGTEATRLTIPYDPPSTVLYTWDDAAGRYRRFVNGLALSDANSGHQIVVANVVVQYAQQVVTDIIEDVEGSHSLKFVLQGSGRAVLLRDGQRFDLTWRRQQAGELTQFQYADGSPAAFAPGNVWIAIVSDTLALE